ncbi:MAG: hypothetical protein ACM3MH_09670 [Actinomycetota bacterium]
MRKYLIAGLLTVAFVSPALAEDFYVAVDLASGRCVMMMGSAPDAKYFKSMGKFSSMKAAHKAMASARECQ